MKLATVETLCSIATKVLALWGLLSLFTQSPILLLWQIRVPPTIEKPVIYVNVQGRDAEILVTSF